MASSVALVRANKHGSFNYDLFPNFSILKTVHALVFVRNSTEMIADCRTYFGLAFCLLLSKLNVLKAGFSMAS